MHLHKSNLCITAIYETKSLAEALWQDPSHALLVSFQRLDLPL